MYIGHSSYNHWKVSDIVEFFSISRYLKTKIKSVSVDTGKEEENFVCCSEEVGGHVFIMEELILLG